VDHVICASQPVEPVEVVDVLLEPPNGVSTAKHHKTAENVQKEIRENERMPLRKASDLLWKWSMWSM
jgi:ubiquitin C-terminal hydrolase